MDLCLISSTERSPCQPDTCENGGTCFETESGFKCLCRVGYSGKTCSGNRIYLLTPQVYSFNAQKGNGNNALPTPVYTGDFCRATQCNFCRAEVASNFEHVRNLMQLRRDKNCIELRDKSRLCKWALQLRATSARQKLHRVARQKSPV